MLSSRPLSTPPWDLSEALNNRYRLPAPGHFGVLLIKMHLLAIVVVAIKWIKRPKTKKNLFSWSLYLSVARNSSGLTFRFILFPKVTAREVDHWNLTWFLVPCSYSLPIVEPRTETFVWVINKWLPLLPCLVRLVYYVIGPLYNSRCTPPPCPPPP